MRLTLCSFLSSLLVLLLLDQLVTLSELLDHRLSLSDRTLHPRMPNDVSEGGTCRRVELEHVRDEVHKLFRQETLGFVALILRPEEVGSVSEEQFVVRVIGMGRAEWWVASVEDEKDDAECE